MVNRENGLLLAIGSLKSLIVFSSIDELSQPAYWNNSTLETCSLSASINSAIGLVRFTESTQFPSPYQCEIMISVVAYFLTISKSNVIVADLKQYLARL